MVSEWCGTMVKNNAGEFEVFCSSGGMYFSYFMAGAITFIAALILIVLLVCLKYTGGLSKMANAAKKANKVVDKAKKVKVQIEEAGALMEDVKNVQNLSDAANLA